MRRKIVWLISTTILTTLLLLISPLRVLADTNPNGGFGQVPNAAALDAANKQALADKATQDAATAEQAKIAAEQMATNKQTIAKAATANAVAADVLYAQLPNIDTLARKLAADASASQAVQDSTQASNTALQRERDATTAENNASKARTAAGIARVMADTAAHNGVGCYATSCNHQDARMSQCNLSQMIFVPITLRDAAGDILATGKTVHSTLCKANWVEGTLTSLGKNIILHIQTNDAQGNTQTTCSPSPNSGQTCDAAGYNGATGWPAASDMLDGTNVVWAQLIATGPDGKDYQSL